MGTQTGTSSDRIQFAEVKHPPLNNIRVVRDGTKLYSTVHNAMRFGNSRDPSPCGGKWVALPFWRPSGGIYVYYTESEYAEIFWGIKPSETVTNHNGS